MKLIGISQAPEGLKARCEACNHAIKNLYHVAFEPDGKTTDMIVGCECVKTLDGIDSNDVDKLTKNLDRAAKEWRKKFPKPFEDEDRPTYINRRLAEMRRSRFAYKEMSRRIQKLEQERAEAQKREHRRLNPNSFMTHAHVSTIGLGLPYDEVLEIAKIARCRMTDFAQRTSTGVWRLRDTWELPQW